MRRRSPRRSLLTASLALVSLALAPAAVAGSLEMPAMSGGVETSSYQIKDKVPVALDDDNADTGRINVKFVENTPVTIDKGTLKTSRWLGLRAFNKATEGKISQVTSLYALSEDALKDLQEQAEERSNSEHATLSQWITLDLADGVDARGFIDELRSLDVIETAYFAAMPVKVPAGDYSGRQGYVGPSSSNGIDATYAHTIPGGTGKNVTIADVEFGWTTNHEDLSKLRNAVITKGRPSESYADHGTAVAGELVADNNGFGVTGIAYDAQMKLSHVATAERGFNVANAIVTAADALEAGDVMVLEQQTYGCGGGFAPIEVMPAAYDAIKAAVAKGIHVVEAAGNGAQNLDQSCYGGANFPGGRGDSGAIIVGASSSRNTSPMSFSTYGTRVDLQAWGEGVYTTGYGDLAGRGNPARQYTAQFSGTSSATPIVAGAVALVSSIAQERGVTISPAEMRDLLVETGTPQQGGRKIGPRPNLKAAIAQIPDGGGNDPDPEPTPTPTPTATPTPDPGEPTPPDACNAYGELLDGELKGGQTAVLPNNLWWQIDKPGKHEVCIDGPDGGDFDVYLQKWDQDKGAWDYVAEGNSDSVTDTLTYTGQAGFYRIVGFSPFDTAGQYVVGYTKP